MEGPLQSSNDKKKLIVRIERQVFVQDHFEETYHKLEPPVPPDGLWNQLKNSVDCSSCNKLSFKSLLTSLFPILIWLPKYTWKKDFILDVVSGCTVAIMHIPQGMGYALLGGVTPIVGIYMAFFPVLVYVFLGTSHHISLGTFAVTTLMTGRIVDQYGKTHPYTNSSMIDSTNETSLDHLTNIEVATVVCFMVGIWQTIMGIFRLGVVGIVLSDHLVSGFTSGAAIHVLTSQLKNLLGLQVPRFGGSFRLIRTYIAIFGSITAANPAAVITSSITIFVLAVHNDWIKPWYSKKIKFPIPTELLILVIGTVISYYCHMNEQYDLKILEHIPTGLPTPRLPPLGLIPSILIDTITVAIVAYAVSLSMAKIFARKRDYHIDNNQELLAQGASNVVGSFFSCMPVAASLSRSLLQESIGGKTQIASVVSCALLLNVLLWIGPFFEALPLAVLASVIIVTLKGMFMQVNDFRTALKISPLDAAVWMTTFLAVVIIDIDIGLGLGVIASISVLIYRGHCPHSAILGHLPGTEIFVDTSLYPSAVEEPGIKIFRWVGAVHFANGETFRSVVDANLAHSSFHPPIATGLELEKEANEESCLRHEEAWDKASSQPLKDHTDVTFFVAVEYLVIDCSAISYVDMGGAKILSTLHSDLKSKRINLSLAGCSNHLLEQLERCNYFKQFPKTQVYPSVIDAVLSIKSAYVTAVDP